MKKASYTKVPPRGWTKLLGRSLFLIVLACCTIGLQLGMSQTTVHPLNVDANGFNYAPSSISVECPSDRKIRYTDDNFNDDALYYDRVGVSRSDTVEFCGQDPWHRVYVTFAMFDIAVGDTLFVFDGDKEALTGMALPNIDTLVGTGVSNANGGWVGASCSPSANPSGCLTFVFKTNGDNNKGTGWDAWVECEDVDLSLDVNITNGKIQCGDSIAWIGIPVPTFNTDCPLDDIEDDTICIIVRNRNGDILPIVPANLASTITPQDTLCGTIGDLRSGTTDLINDFLVSLDLGPGQYVLEMFLQSVPDKRVEPQVFSVSLPGLVCNDEVEVSLNNGCGIQITPDDILENPCEDNESVSYQLQVTLENGRKNDTTIIATGSGTSAALWIPRETLERFGQNTCGGSFDVTVTRIFQPSQTDKMTVDHDNDPSTDEVRTNNFNNGPVSASCTTRVNFRDQTAPVIQLSSDVDTLVVCNEIDTAEVTDLLGSMVIDNCDRDIRQEFHIEYDETDGCFSRNGTPGITRATVTITASDDCGNTTTRTRDFIIQRPFRFTAPSSIQLQCNEYGTVDVEELRGRPGVEVGYKRSNGEFVVTDTMMLSEEEYICGYILLKEKQEVPQTDCGQKEIYVWSVLDWCDSSNGPSVIGSQFVEYTDTVAPYFTDNNLKIVDVALGHFECTIDANSLPRPEARDECSVPDVRIGSISRIEDGERWPIERKDFGQLDCDSFYVLWIAQDPCHTQFVNDTFEQIVIIRDITKPSVITTDQLIVSVPNDWGAIVRVEDIDAGSFDACGIRIREIRREDEPDGWGETITVRCEDIGQELRVYLRVTDLKGNQNTAWMTIRAENRLAAVCADLPTRYVDCNDMPGGTSGLAPSTDADGDGFFEDSEWMPLTGELLHTFRTHFGEFDCSGNNTCTVFSPDNTEEEYQSISLRCGQIEVRRRFRLRNGATHESGPSNSWAHQTIQIGSSGNWKVTLPADVTGTCEEDISAVTPPIIEASACDVIAWEVEDRVFGSAGDACVKIERTYHVINWCNYSPGGPITRMPRFENLLGEVTEPRMVRSNADVNQGLGYFTYIQVLKIQDDEVPVVTIDIPLDTCINGVDFDAQPYGEEDNTYGTRPYECDEEKTWIAWADDCTAEEDFTWVGRLYDGVGNLVREVNTRSLTHPVVGGETYHVEFWASDGCGNTGHMKSEPMTFWDCRPPIAYLLNGVSLNLTADGTIAFWASDVDRGSFDNCTDQSDLRFFIYDPVNGGPAPTNYAEVANLPQTIVFNCTQLGNQAITIYVVDEEGNYDFATTFVNIQDNGVVCPDIIGENRGFIAGSIVNSNGDAVEDVDVSVNGGFTSMQTGTDGTYNFVLAKGTDYTITPEKDIDPLNGVSTFDLVLISKHILGIETFDSPYQYIAADVNRSESITAFDMVQLRQLILNITTEFPNNQSWRFVDADFEFSDTPLSDNFNEFTSINNLNVDRIESDFVAIKVGDVNENAAPSSLVNTSVRSSNDELLLRLNDQFVMAGQQIKVELSSESMAAIQGYQFTMNHEGLDLISIEDGLAKAENFNTNLKNAFTTSWNKTDRSILTDKLFTLNFQATTDGRLSEMLHITSDITAKEAYDEQGQVMDIALDYAGSNIAGFELKQNSPNPYSDRTVIGFNLPKTSTATLTVLDVQGKVLSVIDGTYQKGYNEIQLNAKELGTTGVLYYQLETTDFVATKKMIIID